MSNSINMDALINRFFIIAAADTTSSTAVSANSGITNVPCIRSTNHVHGNILVLNATSSADNTIMIYRTTGAIPSYQSSATGTLVYSHTFKHPTSTTYQHIPIDFIDTSITRGVYTYYIAFKCSAGQLYLGATSFNNSQIIIKDL